MPLRFHIKLGYEYTFHPRTYPNGSLHSLMPHPVFARKRDTTIFHALSIQGNQLSYDKILQHGTKKYYGVFVTTDYAPSQL